MPPRSSRGRPLPKTSFGMFLEGLAPWRNTLVGLAVLVALFVISRVPSLRPPEAAGLALALPAVVVGFGWLRLRDAGPRLLVIGLALGAAVLWLSESEIARVYFPPPPLGAATLSLEHADAQAEAPGRGAMVLEVRGRLRGGGEHAAAASYELVASRGGDERTVEGTLQRKVEHRRQGRLSRAPVTIVEVHETNAHEVSVGRRGPVHLHLARLSGAIVGPLEVAVRPPLQMSTRALALAVVLLLAAAVVQGLARRAHAEAPLAVTVAVALTLAGYVMHVFDADDPLRTTIGALVVAAFAGGLGGWVVGAVGEALLRRREPGAPAS